MCHAPGVAHFVKITIILSRRGTLELRVHWFPFWVILACPYLLLLGLLPRTGLPCLLLPKKKKKEKKKKKWNDYIRGKRSKWKTIVWHLVGLRRSILFSSILQPKQVGKALSFNDTKYLQVLSASISLSCPYWIKCLKCSVFIPMARINYTYQGK